MSEVIKRIQVPLFDEQVSLLRDAVEKGMLAEGPHIEQLAESMQVMFGRKYAVLTANGFSALFAALKCVCPEKANVITASGSTCFAMVNAIKAAGCVPEFCDLELATASMATPELSQGIEGVAMVPDHFGHVASLCKKKSSLLLIEDAAQSFLSLASTKTVSRIVVLSLYPTKLCNGIDGGVILTDDLTLFNRLKKIVTYKDQYELEDSPRYNLRMNNLNAAFALGSLSNIKKIRNDLIQLNQRYTDSLKGSDLKVLSLKNGEVPSRFIVIAKDKSHREFCVSILNEIGISASLELIPLCPPQMIRHFPQMCRLVDTAFSIPFYPFMSEEDASRIEFALRTRF
jgi:dTDP-4-amino-4,6-dideoxygalactose transaminase